MPAREKADDKHFCDYKPSLDQNELNQMLNRLDVTDRHYDRKYQDMQEWINNLYDQIGEIDDSIADINEKISRVYEEQITAKQLCQTLTHFDKAYFKMTALEKKEFLRNLIESIELYPEKQDPCIKKDAGGSLHFAMFINYNEFANCTRLQENLCSLRKRMILWKKN